MGKNAKVIVGIVCFALMMAIAVFTYNFLSGRVSPNIDFGPVSEQSYFSGSYENDKKAHDFTMTDKNGNNVKLSDMAGRAIVLNFWVSWCQPCRNEMPDFETVYRELGEEVQFMMVNLTDGKSETRESAEKFISDAEYTFPVFFDNLREGASAYRVISIPTTVFIDKDGYIAATKPGALDEQSLRQYIAMLTNS